MAGLNLLNLLLPLWATAAGPGFTPVLLPRPRPVPAVEAAASAPTRPHCEQYKVKLPPRNPNLPDHTAEGFQYVEECSRGENFNRVEGAAIVKQFLAGFSRTAGQTLPVYSCFRSQERQDFILCSNDCAPRFGSVDCAGRIAANTSEHTVGAAADFKLKTTLAPGFSYAKEDVEVAKLCKALDQARRQLVGGRGGITIYGIGKSDSIAFLHYDGKSDWCNWGKICEKELGEGHCKRKKFADKEARLLSELAEARKKRVRAEIARIETELKRMRADCKPGDALCRDSFKD